MKFIKYWVPPLHLLAIIEPLLSSGEHCLSYGSLLHSPYAEPTDRVGVSFALHCYFQAIVPSKSVYGMRE